MRQRTLTLALLLFASIAVAQPARIAPGLDLTAPQQLSGFRFGGTIDNDAVLEVVPRGDGFLTFYRHGSEIRVVNIDAEGRPDTAHPRTVLTKSPAFLASNGTRVVFLWIESGTARFSPADSNGALSSPAGVTIAPATVFTAFQCNATRCLVRYQEPSRPTREAAAILSIDGAVIATGLQLPQLFWRGGGGVDDGGFLLTALTGGGIPADPYLTHLVRIDNEGRQTFDTILEAGDAWVVGRAAPGSSTYALIWQRSNYPDPDYGTYAAFLSLDGTVGERHKLMDGADASPARIVWNGTEWLFAYHRIHWRYAIPESTQPADLFVQRLDRSLSPIGSPEQISVSNEGNYLVSLAVNGGKAYVAWNELLGGGFAVIPRGALLDAQARVVARDAFVIGAIPQIALAVTSTGASTGERTLAVWRETDQDRGRTRLLYARAARGGTPIDPQPFVLSDSASVSIGRAAASALESDVLVVWQEELSVEPYAQKLRAAIVHTADGSHEEVALPSTVDGVPPFAVANNGASWLLASGTSYVRISRAGVVLTPQPVQFQTRFPGSLSVASDGTRFLLVWGTFGESGCPSCGGLRYAIVDADGTLVKPEQRLDSGVSDGHASVAFNGTDYLVQSNDGDRLLFRRLSPNGELLSTATLTRPGTSVQGAAVVRLGSGWLATWLQAADGSTRGVRLTADGTVADAPFLLPRIAALASVPDGTAVALTAVSVEIPPYGHSTAVAVQELRPQGQAKRRAAGVP